MAGEETPPLPPTAAEIAHLRGLIETMRTTKDADQKRIDALEARLLAAETKLEKAHDNVKKTGLLDLW